MLSIKRKLSISIKWIFLEKWVKSQQSRRETRMFLRMFYFKKRFNSILIIALGEVEAGGERNEHRNFQ